MQYMVRGALVFGLCWAMCSSAVARADTPEDATRNKEPRALQWGLGVGGYFALTGPSDNGLAAVVELNPGGRFGRYGGRVVARELDSFDGVAVLGGVSYVGAAALPRLQLTLHVDVGGYSVGGVGGPVFGGGVQTLFWVWGPVALGLDGTGYLFYDGVDSRLALAQTLTLRISR